LRTPSLLSLSIMTAVLLAAVPASAQVAAATWPQFQGGPGRTGDALQAPAPPYAVAWSQAAGIGDPSHFAGFPTPVLTDSLAIIVGREDVEAVNVTDGSQAWSIPRTLGPSSPAAVAGSTLLFLEGGGDESTSASASPSPSGSASVSPSPSGQSKHSSPDPASTPTSGSRLVAVDLSTQQRIWTAQLGDISHTGVLVADDVVVAGADDGTVAAFALDDGSLRWSVDAGDRVGAPLAATSDLVISSVQPDTGGTPSVLATKLSDGSEAWRYEPPRSVTDVGGPSVGADAVYLVASDATVRALSIADGTQRWAAPLYTTTPGSPPVVNGNGVFVTDQLGTTYALDPATGAELWRFAANRSVQGAPIATPSAVLQPATNGSIVAIDITSGHQIWETSVSDSIVFGLAATTDSVVASYTGTSPGLVALASQPGAATTDIPSPTTPAPGNLVLFWLLGSVPLVAALVLLGRWMDGRMGRAELETVDDVVDPWETDLGDES
jgi:outer membrane protein assembly factor BamB